MLTAAAMDEAESIKGKTRDAVDQFEYKVVVLQQRVQEAKDRARPPPEPVAVAPSSTPLSNLPTFHVPQFSNDIFLFRSFWSTTMSITQMQQNLTS